MLLNLLPAIRDLRTPLATGYILLFAIYVVLSQTLMEFGQHTQLGQSIVQAAQYIGPAVTLAALSFAAFVVGSIWAEMVPIGVRLTFWGAFVAPANKFRHGWYAKHETLDSAVHKINDLPTFRETIRKGAGIPPREVEDLLFQRVRTLYTENAEFRDEFDHRTTEGYATYLSDDEIARVINVRTHASELLDDLPNIPARLLGREPELWNNFDRLKSEGEFRCSIATAVIPLAVALALASSNWWLTLLVGAIPLWIYGDRKIRDAFSTLVESLRAGRVNLAILDAMDNPSRVHWSRIRADTRPAVHSALVAASEERAEIDRRRREFAERKETSRKETERKREQERAGESTESRKERAERRATMQARAIQAGAEQVQRKIARRQQPDETPSELDRSKSSDEESSLHFSVPPDVVAAALKTDHV